MVAIFGCTSLKWKLYMLFKVGYFPSE